MTKTKQNTYDIAIIGAGPAGLAAAKAVAQRGMRTLVIEKNRIGVTGKTWLTFDESLAAHGLSGVERGRFSSVVFSSYLGNVHRCATKFLCPLDEKKALLTLAGQARTAGAMICDREAFFNYREENGGVTIVTEKGTCHARLAVDAMGSASVILPSNGLSNDRLDMGCLSLFLTNASGYDEDTCLLYDSYFPGRDYFWIVPMGPRTVMAGIFFFSTLSSSNLDEKHAKLMSYIKARKLKGIVTERRMGNIPLGGQKHMAAFPFISFGDSANTALPSSGFSFSRCLHESQTLASFCTMFLDGKKTIRDYKTMMLAEKIPGIEVHLIISDMLSKFTDRMLNKAIGGMGVFGDEFIIDFLSGRDMSLQFCVKALQAILKTFTISEVRDLSLKQEYMKHLASIYNLLGAVPEAHLGKQIMQTLQYLQPREKK